LTETEERPVTNLVDNLSMVLVVGSLVGLLGLLQPIADVVEEGGSFLHLLRHCCHPRVAGFVGADSRRVTVVHHPERRLVE
jgi:hypothetical protein